MSSAASSSPAAPSPEVVQKLGIAKQKKDAGDQAFKAGNLKEALMGYHQSLLYLQGIDKSGLKTALAPPVAEASGAEKEKTEVDEMIEKIYANMSACHIKQENWKRAQETAEKALAKNPDNFKALFRKGKALGEQGYFERAESILEEVARKNPADAAGVNAELSRLRAIDKERERVHNQKLKGWLNRESKKPAKAVADETAAA
ncbi:TPR-like protein [Dentipellis sp. KUC8613]|nr:TPR-like protein [Dentipellis sp. KUC8613]